ncbi:protein kinase domain-containing protein [Legionella sp. D16C41]|uniref:protein kinase domain-containing protein n=1 Tax=Legionella sp. D16C41 TaxID=3402688 RepID=UPI003AF6D484
MQEIKILADSIPSLRQLNKLIAEYNNAANETNEKTKDRKKINGPIYLLTLLKRIERQAKEITNDYEKNPVVDNEDCRNFYIWWGQNRDLLTKEIKEITAIIESKNLFNEISSPPMVRNWKQKTTSMLFRDRSAQYEQVDDSLKKVNQAKANAAKESYLNSELNFNLRQLLLQLEDQVLVTLNNEALAHKDKMTKRFYKLLCQIDASLSRLNSKMSIDDLDLISEKIPEPFISPSRDKPEEFNEVLKHLYLPPDTPHPDYNHNGFNLHFLGGNNNQNWSASNMEGERYVVRIEKADAPNTEYLLVDIVKNNDLAKQFIAEDSLYYPHWIYRPDDNPENARPINFALSEFFPCGNIMQYRKDIDKESLEFVSYEILVITKQIASMALAFTQSKIAYMDIKAENFLIREDGSVVTADLKSLALIEEGMVPNYLITVSPYISAPEQRIQKSALIEPKKFMVYQIGLLLYDLAANLNPEDKNKLVDVLLADEDKAETVKLNFSAPIFQTDIGQEIKQLINDMINKDPEARLTLENVIERCKNLNLNVEEEKERSETSATSKATVKENLEGSKQEISSGPGVPLNF